MLKTFLKYLKVILTQSIILIEGLIYILSAILKNLIALFYKFFDYRIKNVLELLVTRENLNKVVNFQSKIGDKICFANFKGFKNKLFISLELLNNQMLASIVNSLDKDLGRIQNGLGFLYCLVDLK